MGHVLARVPLKMQPAFRGRKHTSTQNVLAAMDFDLRFTYVLASWEGSTHDALILSDSMPVMILVFYNLFERFLCSHSLNFPAIFVPYAPSSRP